MTQNKPEENNKQPRPGNDWEKELDNHPRFGKTWTDKNELFDYLQRDFENDIKSFIRTQIDLAYERGDKDGYTKKNVADHYGGAAYYEGRKKVIEEIKEWIRKYDTSESFAEQFEKDLNDFLNNLEK